MRKFAQDRILIKAVGGLRSTINAGIGAGWIGGIGSIGRMGRIGRIGWTGSGDRQNRMDPLIP